MTTIADSGTMFLKGLVKRLLIVCPKSIVGVWAKEFKKFAEFPYKLTVLGGGTDKNVKLLKQLSGDGLLVAVVNYEAAWRMEQAFVDWDADMIVCDESTKIKTHDAAASKCMHRLGAKSRYNMILTGTPVTNGPENFFSQYKFLDPTVFGTSNFSFKARYIVYGGYGQHAVVSYKNLAELTEKAHSIAFRVRLDEAVDLPPFVDETRVVELEPKAKAVYDSLDRESYADIEDSGEITARNILTRLLRLSQCTGGFIRPDGNEFAVPVSTAKLDALEEILEECAEQGKKTVVFCRFVPEIAAIEKLLKRLKIGYSVIHGGITDRAEQVERFQTESDCKVFIGQLQTTGMGLTLTAASVAVYYSLDYSYANYSQSRARIHRIGQKQRTLYISLIAKGTIDEKVLSVLERKGDVARVLVDEWRSLKGGNTEAEPPLPDDSS